MCRVLVAPSPPPAAPLPPFHLWRGGCGYTLASRVLNRLSSGKKPPLMECNQEKVSCSCSLDISKFVSVKSFQSWRFESYPFVRVLRHSLGWRTNARKVSFRNSLRGPIYLINSVDKKNWINISIWVTAHLPLP